MRISATRHAVFRVVLAGAGVLLGLLALELGLRTVGTVPEVENPLYSFHQSDPLLGWIGVPGIRRRFVRADFDVLIEHDEDGFRRPQPSPPRDADDCVLVLGDSYVWGWGVGQGEVFTDWMQRRLGPRIAVYNRGVNAFGTTQELLLLRRELERHPCGRVVLLFTGNDFRDNLDGKAGRRPYFDLDGSRLVPRNQPAARLMSPVRRLLKASRAVVWLDYRVSLAADRLLGAGDGGGSGDPHLPAPTEREIAVTERLLVEMRRTAEAAGADLTIVSWQGPPYREPLARLCRQASLRCLDLSPAFFDGGAMRAELRFASDGHWSPAGHRLAAELLTGATRAGLDLRTPPSARPSPTPVLRSTSPDRSPDSPRTAKSGTL